MRLIRPAARVPLSNHDLQRLVHTHLQELKRARESEADLRELWHEEQMNAALDTLALRLPQTAPPLETTGGP